MTRFVALLRGINVGHTKRVSMTELQEVFVKLGFAEVRTYLQSGNVLFSSTLADEDQLAMQIEDAIKTSLGVSIRTLVRNGAQLRKVVDENPFRDAAGDGSKLLVLFLFGEPDPKLLAAHDPRELAPGEVAIGERVIYQWCPNGVRAAPDVGTFVEKYLGVLMTARNWNTVNKLAELLNG